MESSYSTKYLSENLTVKHFGNNPDRIGESLYNSKISLNPHQIQAALFAFSSPISKGVMLCDEVGLGKTIEAGIVITQYWCEHKRNILIITPASLTRQWAVELEDKFNLPAVVMDRKYYRNLAKKGIIRPFELKDKIIITSLNFASNLSEEIKKSHIDLVVIDEAHKLRNVYNPSNIIANNIKNAIGPFKKLLLTATPLQNNLMELYGLSLLIDENIFGDKAYFKHQFIKEYDINKIELRDRLQKYIHRTLRNQVQKYVKYSSRITHTFTFSPSEKEILLEKKITDLIQSNPTFGMKEGQSWLLSLILRKLLSSSTTAVIHTLNCIKARLEGLLNGMIVDDQIFLDSDEEIIDGYDTDDNDDNDFKLDVSTENLLIELTQVEECLEVANKIKDDRKAYKLLDALSFLFENLTENRAKKVLIFTESTRTQNYLFNFLNNHGYNSVVLFNGGNTDPKAKEIYDNWISKPENQALQNNGKATNVRTAMLDYFKNSAEIMIATEAGAEGLNIQFCSMMINYDLPWNPQRVEQRIGRCHRYGQKNDVIVINFLNESNQIDMRIYELLKNKFKLFDDVFGASDEILGKIDSESNFEKEIFSIYSSCRTPEEIDKAFDELQKKYKTDISAEMKKTRKLLIDNFDEDLQQIFDSILEDAKFQIKDIEDNFWRICNYILGPISKFGTYSFSLLNDFKEMKAGTYCVANEDRNLINLRYNDENGERIIQAAKNIKLANSVKFDISNYKFKILELENLKGKKGVISFGKVKIDSFEQEEYFVITGRMEDGTFLNSETASKLFRLDSYDSDEILSLQKAKEICNEDFKVACSSTINKATEANSKTLAEEINRIDEWANDKISAIQLKVEQLREQRKNLQKESDYTTNSIEKINLESEINKISKTIKKLWLELAENEDIIDKKRKEIIQKLKAESMKKIETIKFFDMNFEVI